MESDDAELDEEYIIKPQSLKLKFLD